MFLCDILGVDSNGVVPLEKIIYGSNQLAKFFYKGADSINFKLCEPRLNTYIIIFHTFFINKIQNIIIITWTVICLRPILIIISKREFFQFECWFKATLREVAKDKLHRELFRAGFSFTKTLSNARSFFVTF